MTSPIYVISTKVGQEGRAEGWVAESGRRGEWTGTGQQAQMD